MDKKKALELHKKMIKQGSIPTELFKHTAISNGLYKTLINSELWFAAPTSFNDPFDCQINDQTNWTDNNIRNYVSRTNSIGIDPEDVVQANQQTPGSFNQFFTNHLKKTLSKIGVTCFLQKPDNLLLWAHYSDSHKGVCLKFDITKDPDFFSKTFAVKYSSQYPNFDYLTERDQLTNKAILTKSEHWEYEDEIRTIQDTFGLYPFKKECLTEIIFGCKTDPNEIKTIRQIVTNAGYPNLTLKQVKLKTNQYDIDIINI
ncbi:DUF2971 domain-containing protein [Patiriisocius sp. Uisw_017]|uniref:DUF2971 domain-containing protein n=1 Tax=Patiriisocius sp. Uisw_017 TaxID=3230968 RepID=UPI0039EB9274